MNSPLIGLSCKGEFLKAIGLTCATFQKVATHSPLDVALGDNNQHRHGSGLLGSNSPLLYKVAVGVHKSPFAAHKELISSLATEPFGFAKSIFGLILHLFV